MVLVTFHESQLATCLWDYIKKKPWGMKKKPVVLVLDPSAGNGNPTNEDIPIELSNNNNYACQARTLVI